MRFQGNFETFKFVDHGGKIQGVMDYIEGESIFYKIQNAEQFTKSQVYRWLNELCLQLEYFHKYKHHAYQYLNPYTLIIANDQQVRLLNMESKENEDILFYIQKSVIKNLFYYQSNSKRNKIYTDYYSLGKLLQFLLSSGDFTPHLKVQETRTFSKIIQRCLSNNSEYQYQNMKQIQKKIPKVKEEKQKNNRVLFKCYIRIKKPIILLVAVALVCEIGYWGSKRLVHSNLNQSQIVSVKEKDYKNEQTLLLESGVILLATLENLEMSQETFEKITTVNSLGGAYEKLVSYYIGELNLTEEDIQVLLQNMEEEGSKEIQDEYMYNLHMLNIIRGYHRLNTEESDTLLIKSMDVYMNSKEVLFINSRYTQEVLGYLLQANIAVGELEEAKEIIELLK